MQAEYNRKGDLGAGVAEESDAAELQTPRLSAKSDREDMY